MAALGHRAAGRRRPHWLAARSHTSQLHKKAPRWVAEARCVKDAPVRTSKKCRRGNFHPAASARRTNNFAAPPSQARRAELKRPHPAACQGRSGWRAGCVVAPSSSPCWGWCCNALLVKATNRARSALSLRRYPVPHFYRFASVPRGLVRSGCISSKELSSLWSGGWLRSTPRPNSPNA